MSDCPSSICLFGAGGHGRVVAAQMRAAGYQSLLFTDHTAQPGAVIDGVPVYSNQNGVAEDFASLVTIGDNRVRKDIHDRLLSQNQILTRFICPRAVVHSEHPIGLGSMVLSGAVINPGAKVGRSVIVNSSAVIEHDCHVGDFCHVSPNATLAGGVTLGEGVWIGAGAVVIPGLSIAPWTTVGAGAVVTNSIATAGTYVGVPARLQQER